MHIDIHKLKQNQKPQFMERRDEMGYHKNLVITAKFRASWEKSRGVKDYELTH